MEETYFGIPDQNRSYRPLNVFGAAKDPNRLCCEFPQIPSSRMVNRIRCPKHLLHNGRAPPPRAGETLASFYTFPKTNTMSYVRFSNIRTIFAILLFRALYKTAVPSAQIPASGK